MMSNQSFYRRTDTKRLQNMVLSHSTNSNSPTQIPETCLGSLAVASDSQQHEISLGQKKRQYSASAMIFDGDITSKRHKLATGVFPNAKQISYQAATGHAIPYETDHGHDAALLDVISENCTTSERHKIATETFEAKCVSAAWDVVCSLPNEKDHDADTELMDYLSENEIASKRPEFATGAILTTDQTTIHAAVAHSLPSETDHDAELLDGLSEYGMTSKQQQIFAAETLFSLTAEQTASQTAPAHSLQAYEAHGHTELRDGHSENNILEERENIAVHALKILESQTVPKLHHNFRDVKHGTCGTKRTALSETFSVHVHNRIPGHCHVPPSTKHPSDWTYEQRQECRMRTQGEKSGTPERFERPSSSDGFVRNNKCKHSLKWSQKFDELVLYKEMHGSCLIPQKCKENNHHGRWVRAQHEASKNLEDGKKSALTQEHRGKIGSAGFRWQANNVPSWSQRFDELAWYKELHENFLVPQNYTENPELGRWVNRQRMAHKNLRDGKPSALTQERLENLEAIGFRWQVPVHSRVSAWPQRFDELVRYKELHGNCLVPYRYKENKQLGHWVKTQRAEYKKLQGGKNSALTQERLEKLQAIGFRWRVKNDVPAWPRRFDELVLYKEMHGNCLVPYEYKENPELGRWVQTQRKEHKKLQNGKQSALTQERLEKLQAIGFRWQVQTRAPSWSQMFEKLDHYKQIHGNCLVSTTYMEHSELGQWVNTQRFEYKKFWEGKQSSLTQERISMLGAMGFEFQVTHPPADG